MLKERMRVQAALAKRREAETKAANERRHQIQLEWARRVFPRRVYRSPAPQSERIWQLDLLDMSTKPGMLAGYALASVDVHTRTQRWALMKNKDASSVLSAVRASFDRAGFTPGKLHADQEPALLSGAVQSELKTLGVVVYHTPHSPHGAGLAENAIRSFRLWLKEQKRLSWKAALRLGDETNSPWELEANSRVVPSLGKSPDELERMAPDEVSKLHASRERDAAKQAPEAPAKLQIGALVLVQNLPERFAKVGRTENWGRTLYEVTGVSDGPPIMYTLKRSSDGHPMPNRFYKEQLKEVKGADLKLFA